MNRLLELSEVVASGVLEDAIETGELLAKLKIPHALPIGELDGANVAIRIL